MLLDLWAFRKQGNFMKRCITVTIEAKQFGSKKKTKHISMYSKCTGYDRSFIK